MEYLNKDKIIFEQKPHPDYSNIPKREVSERPTSTKHVFRDLSPHNQMVDELEHGARLKNLERIKQMEVEAEKAGKSIVWYCCDFVRDILEGALKIGVRHDDFWQSFVPSFAGYENYHYSDLKKEMGIEAPPNHQFSGYTCEGTGYLVFGENVVFKLKEGVKRHLERLEDNNIRLYYLECLMMDIQNSKQIQAYSGKGKYNREIQPLYRWLEKQARKVKTAAPLAGDTRPLYPFFHGSKELDLALKAAADMGLIGESGKWKHNGYKTNALSVWWRAAVKAELAKADAPIYKVITAIRAQFSEYFGQNAIDKKRDIADFREEYKKLYKNLLEIMTPRKT